MGLGFKVLGLGFRVSQAVEVGVKGFLAVLLGWERAPRPLALTLNPKAEL